MNTQNKICVYAICKNESKFVKQWLDSMSEADYIVVLDTGSTDNTVNMNGSSIKLGSATVNGTKSYGDFDVDTNVNVTANSFLNIMDNEKLAIDEAVEKFRALMEGQLARAKKIKEDC